MAHNVPNNKYILRILKKNRIHARNTNKKYSGGDTTFENVKQTAKNIGKTIRKKVTRGYSAIKNTFRKKKDISFEPMFNYRSDNTVINPLQANQPVSGVASIQTPDNTVTNPLHANNQDVSFATDIAIAIARALSHSLHQTPGGFIYFDELFVIDNSISYYDPSNEIHRL